MLNMGKYERYLESSIPTQSIVFGKLNKQTLVIVPAYNGCQLSDE